MATAISQTALLSSSGLYNACIALSSRQSCSQARLGALSKRFTGNVSSLRRNVLSCTAKRSTRNLVFAQAASDESSTAETVAAIGGLVSVPVVAYSLFVLKTTGCGLPPGPGGSVGALEGVSYLVILGLVGWSAYTKVKTGSGLPNGPFGILGAVEGLSYLVLLAAIVVFGLQLVDYGFIPPPVPGEQCFG
eukprot:jgi/Mesen1/10136/ME000076S09644